MRVERLAESFHSVLGRRTGIVLLLLLWCAALIGARFFFSSRVTYLFLGWNLFLALVPLVAARLLILARGRRTLEVTLFLVWLLFFPNAPYLLTDLIHLEPKPRVPEWYDLALLLSCAGTGLFLGYVSLLEIHAWMEKHLGRWWGWSISISVLFLSAFGIYLGRFLRWNSWDVLTEPGRLFHDVVVSLTHPAMLPRALGVTLLFGVMLTLGYLAIQSVAEPRNK
jgi:uncharacterized membrane protein